MMILQPPHATEELVAQATAKVRRAEPAAAVDGVRLARLAEGRCAQVLHTGPYREETPTIERLHAFVRAQGCVPAGRHHEIYLSDPTRTAPGEAQDDHPPPRGRRGLSPPGAGGP
jgi:hypothetical protein